LADEWFSFFPAGALEAIRADLGLNYAEAGMMLTALGAGGLVGNGITVAADFVSRRVLASLGALAYALCLTAFALGTSFPVLLLAALVWGAASDAFVHGLEVALVDLAGDDLPATLGRVNALGAVGDLLGPLTLATAAAIGLSWRAVFAAGAALMLAYAFWIALLRLPAPRPRSAQGRASPLATILEVARDRRIIALAVVDLLFGLLDEPLLGFTIAYLEHDRGLPAASATIVAAVITASGIAGFLGVPLVTQRASSRSILVGSSSILTGAIALMIVAPVLPLQLLAAAAFGVAGALFWSVLQATTLSLRPGQAGTSQAVISTIGLLGVGVPTLVGAAADALGLALGLALYATVAFAIVIIVTLRRLGLG
jgi:predicted MFS family arabinose efflux permease